MSTLRNVFNEDTMSEKQRNNIQYLKDRVDYTISTLVTDTEKERIVLARNLYAAKRSPEQFAALEEMYGIGSPVSVKFKPLTAKIVNSLVGKFADTDIEYRAVCTDQTTIQKIQNDKKQAILNVLYDNMRKQLEYSSKYFNKFQEDGYPKPILDERTMDEVRRHFELDWKSSYEIQCNKVLDYYMRDPNIAAKHKMEEIVKDFIMTGKCAFSHRINRLGDDVELVYCLPEHIHFDVVNFLGNTDDATACVYVEYLTKKQILTKYGHELNKEDKDYIVNRMGFIGGDESLNAKIFGYEEGDAESRMTRNGEGVDHKDAPYSEHLVTYPVYHTEWIVNTPITISSEEHINRYKTTSASYVNGKKKITAYREDRYEGIRISDGIYIRMGKSLTMPRSNSNYFKARLSYRAFYNNIDKNSKEPYSVMLATKDLQDDYDMLNMIRDTIIASSGNGGVIMNPKAIPRSFGNSIEERMINFMKHMKSGFMWVEPQESESFNNYGNFSNSMDANVLSAIDNIISRMEQQVFMLSSTSPQLIGEVEQREAVSNVKQVITQVDMMNKTLFNSVQRVCKTILTDVIDYSKITYKYGSRALNIMSEQGVNIYTLDGQLFSSSDYAVFIGDSMDDKNILNTARQTVMNMSQNGTIDALTALRLQTSRSTTEMMQHITYINNKNQAKEATKQEMQSQVDSANQQLQQVQQQLQALQAKNMELEERKIKLAENEVRLKAENDKARIELEKEKLTHSKKDDEAKNDLKEQEIAIRGITRSLR